MERSKSSIRKEVVSEVAPCNFIYKAKRQLQEIQDYKSKIQWFDREIHPEESSQYFQKIESALEDQNALEWLRVRSLVRECFKSTEKEVKEHVKELLSANVPGPSVLPETSSSLPVPATKVKHPYPSGRPPASSKQCKARQTTVVPRSIRSKQSSSIGNTLSKAPTGSAQCRCLSASNPVKSHEPEEKYTKADLMSDQKLFLKVQKYCPSLINKESSVARKEKYFPCAIPLSEPCCKKPVFPDLRAEEPDSPSLPQNSHRNILLMNVDCDRVHKKTLTQQKLPSINIEAKSFRPATTNNTGLFSVRDDSSPSEDEEDEAEHPSMPALQGYLPSSHAAIQVRIEDKNQSTSEEKLSRSFERPRNPKFNPDVLSQIIAALNRSDSLLRSQPERANEQNLQEPQRASEQNLQEPHRVSEQNLQEPQRANEQNLQEPQRISEQNLQEPEMDINTEHLITKDGNDFSCNRETPVISKAVQTSIDGRNQPVSMVSQSVQVTQEKVYVSEKAQQTEVLQSEHLIQTDLQGLDGQLVIRGQDTDARAQCGVLCSMPEELSPVIRTSTPSSDIGCRNQALAESAFSPALLAESVVSHPIESLSGKKHAGIQCIANAACQTHPEMLDVGIQTEGSIECAAITNMHKVDAWVQMSSNVGHSRVSSGPCANKPNVVQQDEDKEVSQKCMKDSAVQYEMLDVNSEGAISNTTMSDSEFMDDLLSEGEILLPCNLRLLSLNDRSGLRSFQRSDSCGENDYHLSEGEIPPSFLRRVAMQENFSSCNSEASAFPSTSDTSPDVAVRKWRLAATAQTSLLPHISGQVLSSSFSSSGEKLSSDLMPASSSDGQSISEGEVPLTSMPSCSYAGVLQRSTKFEEHLITWDISSPPSESSLDGRVARSLPILFPAHTPSCSASEVPPREAKLDIAADVESDSGSHRLTTVAEETSCGSSSATHEELSERNPNPDTSAIS